MSLHHNLLGLLFVCGVLACNGSRTRIINGVKAELGEFPYQVSVQVNNSLWCGGVILDERHVLTAAHCFVEAAYHVKVEEVSVVVGSIDLSSQTNPGTRYQVDEMKLHENYHYGNGWPDDVALLKLSEPIQFNEFIKPAALPKSDDKIKDGQPAVVSGYGKLNPKSNPSPILYKTKVFIESNDKCQQRYYDDPIRSTNICTRNSRMTGWCKGDSGGPLTMNGKVVGLVSFSLDLGCAWVSMAPQVYTRVSEYIQWINQHM